MKALLVDDQPNVRLLLSRVLRRKAGYLTADAENGVAALQWLGRERFDLVVLDLLGAPMKGIETLEVMRRTPALRNLPVVVMSEASHESLVREVARFGIAGYLVKPLRPVDVSERFHDILLRIGAPKGVDGESVVPVRDALAFRPDLRPALSSATTQVLGLSLGLGLTPSDRDHTPQAGDDVATVRMESEEVGHEDLELVVTAPRDTTARMTAAGLQRSGEVDEAVATALRAATLSIANRLRHVLSQRGDTVTLGDVAVGRIRESDVDDTRGLQVSFDMVGAGRLRATVRAVPAMVEPDVPSSPDTPPVDRAVLEMLDSLREPGQPDVLGEIVGLFLSDTPRRLAELRDPGLSPEALARVAHSVKGAAGNVGASGLHRLLSQLEAAAREGLGVGHLTRLIAAVDDEYQRVDQDLRAVMADRSA